MDELDKVSRKIWTLHLWASADQWWMHFLQELVACMALEYSVARLHRQPVSVLRTMAQHASVGDGGLSPSTAGKHTDKEDKELVLDPPAATPLKHPSTTSITAISATNAPIFEENFNVLVLFSIAALLKPDKLCQRRSDDMMEQRNEVMSMSSTERV